MRKLRNVMMVVAGMVGSIMPAAFAEVPPTQQTNIGSFSGGYDSMNGHPNGCVIAPSRRVFCVGFNSQGDLGNGSLSPIEDFNNAVPVVGVYDAAKIVVRGGRCTMTAVGEIWCWGPYWSTSGSPVKAPVSDALDLALNDSGAIACAVRRVGGVWCWGGGAGSPDWFGPGKSSSQTPVMISNTNDVRTVAMSALSGCGVTASAKVKCWGMNYNGEVAVPRSDCAPLRSGDPFCYSAVEAVGLADVASVQMSGVNGCAKTQFSWLFCWGQAYWGQLGAGGRQEPSLPVLASPRKVNDYSVGFVNVCGIDSDHSFWCQGYGIGPQAVISMANKFDDGGCAVGTDEWRICPLGWSDGATYGTRPGGWRWRLNLPTAGQVPPQTPTGVTAMGNDGSALITWSAAVDANHADYYVVTATPSGLQCQASYPANSCVVSGLVNRSRYSFTVTAINLNGTSQPSVASAPVMPLFPEFQVWPADEVLTVGSSTTLTLARAAMGVSIAISGGTKATAVSDADGFGTVAYSAVKVGIQKFTATYSVKVGKKTTKYTATTQLYVPSLFGPMLKIKQGKTGKFSLQFMPPGAAVAIALSDGRTLTGTADSAGKASFTPSFNTLGAVTYTASVAGVQVGTGGLTVTK